jgi:hypothetical protein
VPANNPLYTEHGTIRTAGSLWVSGGILEVYADSIVVIHERLFRRRRYFLPKASITRLSDDRLAWFMFSGALRIDHSIMSYPIFLFWSRDIDILTVQLRQFGFPLSTSHA